LESSSPKRRFQGGRRARLRRRPRSAGVVDLKEVEEPARRPRASAAGPISPGFSRINYPILLFLQFYVTKICCVFLILLVLILCLRVCSANFECPRVLGLPDSNTVRRFLVFDLS
jgi:hypothetical protein